MSARSTWRRGAFAAAIVALLCGAFIAWRASRTASGDAAAAPAAPAPSARKAPPNPGPSTARAEPALDAPTRVDAGSDNGSPTDAMATTGCCVLYGTIHPASLGAVFDEPPAFSITDRLANGLHGEAALDGSYSVAGLDPGRYWLTAQDRQGGRAAEVVDLAPGEREKQLDLHLRCEVRVPVRVVDGDGHPAAGDFEAAATLEPPGPWIDGCLGFENHCGAGRFESNGDPHPELADEYIGVVVLDEPPPVYISLMFGERVVATQRVARDGAEASFVVDAADPLLQRGSLRARFIDAESGAPIANATTLLTMGSGSVTKLDMDGVLSRSGLPPGTLSIRFMPTDGYALGALQARIEPGRTTDLGDISVERAVSISGTVLDESGRGVAARIIVERLDPRTGAPARSRVHFGTNASRANGSFRIGALERARYRLSIRGDPRFGAWAQTVDAGAGPVENLTIHLAQGIALILQPEPHSSVVEARIHDSVGETVATCGPIRLAPEGVLLAAGEYEVEVLRKGEIDPTQLRVTIGSEPVELALP